MRVANLLIIIRYKAVRTLLAAVFLLGLLTLVIFSEPISSSVLGPLKQRLIVIDAGHGGIDGGANRPGFLEKDINLAVAKKLKTELQKSGAKVILTRDKDDSLDDLTDKSRSRHRRDLLARTEIIKENQPDLFISLHVNASRRGKANGPMVFFNKRVPKSEHLAKSVQSSLNAAAYEAELKKHLARPGDYFILNNTQCPGVIVEMGFVTNPREKDLLKSEQYQQQLAEHIGLGIRKYFSEKPTSTPARSLTVSQPSTIDNPGVFFPKEGEDLLVSEPLEGAQTTLAREDDPSDTIKTAIRHLITGPQSAHLEPIFDSKTKLLDLSLQDGIVTLDFSSEVRQFEHGSEGEYLAVTALVQTVGQFPQVAGVKILIEGQEFDTLGQHIDISRVLTPHQTKAKVAIVIDDLASSDKGLKELLALGRPLTMAVMPKKETTKQTADLVFDKGLEVFLHLPMEPEQGKASWLGEGAITSVMDPMEVARQVTEDLSSVPHAVGLNNHMGSKITKRKDLMIEVLKVAKAKHLIVLDSRTTDQTVIPQLASKLHIPYIYRSVFLDEINSVAHVKKQIRELAKIALEKGSAIAIGHVGPTGENTAQGLKEMIPWLEQQGIELVFASQLVSR